MNILNFTKTNLLFICLSISCASSQKAGTNEVYYGRFDIFKLSGSDTIPASTVKDSKSSGVIKVSYKDKIPDNITYYFPSRKVVLTLDTIFRFNNRDVYVFYTGNLLGGKAGRQREYSFHYIDNGYKLFIDVTDTIVVKRYDNIDIKSGTGYHYMIDVYTKHESQLSSFSLLQDDAKTRWREDTLYNYWMTELRFAKPKVISKITSFPPN